jgi:hypothetical protein
MATLPLPFTSKTGRPRKNLDAKRILALRAQGFLARDRKAGALGQGRHFAPLRGVPKVFLNRAEARPQRACP